MSLLVRSVDATSEYRRIDIHSSKNLIDGFYLVLQTFRGVNWSSRHGSGTTCAVHNFSNGTAWNLLSYHIQNRKTSTLHYRMVRSRMESCSLRLDGGSFLLYLRLFTYFWIKRFWISCSSGGNRNSIDDIQHVIADDTSGGRQPLTDGRFDSCMRYC